MHGILPFLLAMIAAIVLLEMLATKLQVAYPIVLVVAGLVDPSVTGLLSNWNRFVSWPFQTPYMVYGGKHFLILMISTARMKRRLDESQKHLRLPAHQEILSRVSYNGC